MKKVFWLVPCTVLCISLYAEDIHISENYKKHYCKEIQKIYYSNPSNLKSDLLTGLKAKASQLGANSIVRVEFTHSIFSNNTAEGIAANCDISKSPEFFLKSPLRNGEDIRSYSTVESSKGKIFVGIGMTKGQGTHTTNVLNSDLYVVGVIFPLIQVHSL